MRVESILPVGKKKCKVLLAEGFAFVLYIGEAKRFRIQEGQELSPQTYQIIEKEILEKRAMERCIRLLKDSDRTESQLRRKLEEDSYPEPVIARTLKILAEHRYVNDASYAQRYVELGGSHKSVRQMAWELERKGVSKEYISQALQEAAPQEEEAIRTLARKKAGDIHSLSTKELYKLYAYLARKGFSYEAIRRALSIEAEDSI